MKPKPETEDPDDPEDPVDPKPEPQQNQKPAPQTAPERCKLSFDVSGGIDLTGKIVTAAIDNKAITCGSTLELNPGLGETITLPKLKMKGYKFKGWKTTVDGVEVVLKAGKRFTVTGAQSFTAVWEKK